MTTIVTGASGMLGSAIVRGLIERERQVEGWARSVSQAPDGAEFVQMDLRSSEDAWWRWKKSKAKLIIHCAALTDADFCEENRHIAREVNAVVSGDLAKYAKELGARFVYVSTDAVYDGSRPGRRKEDSTPRPASVYAQTKLEGEERVLAAYPEALVVRTTMFGWTLPMAPRPKLAEEILAALSAGRPIQLWRDAIFSPLHVSDLADALLFLGDTKESGILNVGAQNAVSKAEFGRQIAAVFGLDVSLVKEVSVDDTPAKAPRPKNVGLNTSRYRQVRGQGPPSVVLGIGRLHRDSIDGTAERIRGRKDFP